MQLDISLNPRKIRIQYYRYLFGRNLWLKLYNKEFPYTIFLNLLFNNEVETDYNDDKLFEKVEYVVEMVKAY